MSRNNSFPGALLTLCLLGSGALRAQSFELAFEGPDSLCGEPGIRLTAPYYSTLTSTGADLAAGWSFGVTVEGGVIRCVTTAGTAAEEFDDGTGFQKSEITTGEGNEGAISIVVLSTTQPRTLPGNSTHRVAVLDVEVAISGGEATLRYQSGLEGVGEPIIVDVTDQDARGHMPALGEKVIGLVPDTGAPCDPFNPDGFIRTDAWNILLGLGNVHGCSGGGPESLERNWVAPHDLARETAAPGEEWSDIDFLGAAAASGFEPAALYAAFGLSGAPTWLTTELLEDLSDADLPNRNLVDLDEIVAILNATAAPALGVPNVYSDNVLACAQTQVENTTNETICVDVCSASFDSLRVWVNEEPITSVSRCGRICGDCSERRAAHLVPGLNRITVVAWEGRGAWGFKLGLEDPDTGAKLTNTSQTDVIFRGAAPLGPPAAGSALTVRRLIANPDGCPTDSTRVTLRGSGGGTGAIAITETYPSILVTSDSFTNVSDGGVVEGIGDIGGFPEAFRISWNVPIEVLTGAGIHYDVALPTATSALPEGVVDDCMLVGGDGEVYGPRPSMGPVRVLDDSHDIGTANDLAGSEGSLNLAGEEFIITGSGRGLQDSGDSFHFAYKRLAGDFSTTVEVTDRVFPPSGGRDAAYGLMAREDCTPRSRHATVHANLEADPGAGRPRGDAVFYRFRREHRSQSMTDASQAYVFPDPDIDGPELENQPRFFRLDRRGEIISGYASFDGKDWRLVGSSSWEGLDSGAELLVGFAYARGRTATESGTIRFTNLRFGPSRDAEFFNNDAGNPGATLYQSAFEQVPIGELPPEFTVNTNSGGGGGAGRADGAGAGFAPIVVGGRLRLTEEGATGLATSAFLERPVPIASGEIVIEYTVWVTHSGVTSQPVEGDPNPGYGITMTVLAGTDTSRLGGSSDALGFDGIARSFDDAAPSLAVESDTWGSAAFGEGSGSPVNDGTWHLGINSGGNTSSVAVNSSDLPDIFAPEGVRHRVVIRSDGRVSVFLAPAGGGGGGAGMTPAAEAQIEPLDAQGHMEGVVGFTSGNGEDGTQTSEVGDIEVSVTDCSDNAETARVSGPSSAFVGDMVRLDGSASDAGVGDGLELLTYEWEVSGAAQVVGPTDGPILTMIVDDGEAVGRLRVDDGACDNASQVEHRVMGVQRPRNWMTYDTNNDGLVNITDPTFHLNFLFLGGLEPGCAPATDFDNDGVRNITDPIAALNFLFLGGPRPPREVGCQVYVTCETGDGCAP